MKAPPGRYVREAPIKKEYWGVLRLVSFLFQGVWEKINDLNIWGRKIRRNPWHIKQKKKGEAVSGGHCGE